MEEGKKLKDNKNTEEISGLLRNYTYVVVGGCVLLGICKLPTILIKSCIGRRTLAIGTLAIMCIALVSCISTFVWRLIHQKDIMIDSTITQNLCKGDMILPILTILLTHVMTGGLMLYGMYSEGLLSTGSCLSYILSWVLYGSAIVGMVHYRHKETGLETWKKFSVCMDYAIHETLVVIWIPCLCVLLQRLVTLAFK